ncbi:hypothetical protein K470DRAFT_249729 [Piedraia hortae CBS 480.64]|uniref:Histone transcription regulator 3 homolog n=1 Tax=Piedraia hortae CBS 480.64 TaxID=1314780 RepID=A0A6A7BVD9_9PEZI|nr:hypothetical protein K470DRAFT_249729 [Piedraia hortae CBS 480.64]
MMTTGWKALNLESDSESDVEIDDTKELQIEDALKLYQSAVKYHAEGPASFDKAAAAYQELFRSEIFQYPESQSELQRIELYGPTVDDDDSQWNEIVGGEDVTANGGFETGASTLPLILHRSHKSYGQFKLDYLVSRLDGRDGMLGEIHREAAEALYHFVQALDKDSTDLDLWDKTATVGEVLDSKRIARFCLESVLSEDSEGLQDFLAVLGLEESLASERLLRLIVELQDSLSEKLAPLGIGKPRVLTEALKKRLLSCDGLAAYEKSLRSRSDEPDHQPIPPERITFTAPKSWTEVGEFILRDLLPEAQREDRLAPASAISFVSSEQSRPLAGAIEAPPNSMEIDTQVQNLQPETSVSSLTADVSITEVDGTTQSLTIQSQIEAEHSTIARKRSVDAAGLVQDGNEEGRGKSKRLRARDSNVDENSHRQAMMEANARWECEQQLNEIQSADDWMYVTVGNLFERVGVSGFERAKDIRKHPGASTGPLHGAKQLLSDFFHNFSEPMCSVLLQKGEDKKAPNVADQANLFSTPSSVSKSGSAVELTDEGLDRLVAMVNDGWFLPQEVALIFLANGLLRPSQGESHYSRFAWSDRLKEAVIAALVYFDEFFLQQIQQDLQRASFSQADGQEVDQVAEVAEAIFELHLDNFYSESQYKDAESAPFERLERWAELAREAVQLRVESNVDPQKVLNDKLNLRFLWASTFTIAAVPGAHQKHVIECMKDLRTTLASAGEPAIHLPNNTFMSSLSLATIDCETTRLTTRDFLDRVANQDMSDPASVIESLEPLLFALDEDSTGPYDPDASLAASQIPLKLVGLIKSSELSVRLMLWERLLKAYQLIEYNPMVVVCHFRIMQMVVVELRSVSSTDQSQKSTVLKCLRLLEGSVQDLYTIIRESEDALTCIDETLLKSILAMFADVMQLMQMFNVYEDSIRTGQTKPPMQPDGLSYPSLDHAKALLQDMQVKTWMILYCLLQEAIAQTPEAYPNSTGDKFDFLCSVHRNLGIRGICGRCNRAFVRMMNKELANMKSAPTYDTEQAQILYDLTGLKCFRDPSYELMDHRCTPDALLDRGLAMQAMDLLLEQANKIPVKELIKHPLKDTIETVHAAVTRKKPTDLILRNRDIYRAFFRSPINPLDIFNCLKGQGSNLSIYHIRKEDAPLAEKGWYFLMGNLALTKFRSQKRSAATASEDVGLAIAYFNQELEYNMDNWETWFRVAQAHDTKIEESVVWTAEKLNNSMQEITALQRTAIHCYTLATALALRSADIGPQTSDKLTELYRDFAARLYASSREPFRMLAFQMEDSEKFFSRESGMGRGQPFRPLKEYTVWKLVKVLYQRALAGTKQPDWRLKFSLGKCLWKMHTARDIEPHDVVPTTDEVLQIFIESINLLPDTKKDKKEPILEPHYKLVSIVHKLVTRGELDLTKASSTLSHTPFSRPATVPRYIDEWSSYILTILNHLRSADKSNWHHRMTARSAQIIYDEHATRLVGDATYFSSLGILGAKDELTKHMFTKTMVLQVWRPECERPGRHFVYTSRYTRFFTKILHQLEDRQGLEMLARRVRRRPHDLFEHTLVWQEICNAYLKLLRAHGNIPEGFETMIFSTISHEMFLQRKEALERWMQATQETGRNRALDTLREAIELKKINTGLLKTRTGPIDDLIGDAYAYLFDSVGRQLWQEEEERAREVQRNPVMDLSHLLSAGSGTAVAETPQRRKIGVSKREIKACAEKAVVAPSAKVSGGLVRRGTGESAVGKVGGLAGTGGNVTSGIGSAVTSAPGSVLDSSDVGSELTDLEEGGNEEGDVEMVDVNS